MTCMTHIRLFYHPSIIMKWSALPCRVQHSQPCWLQLSLLVHMHCTLHIVYLYCVQCGHCLAHKTCVNDTKKCRTLTAFSLRLCPDMQAASRKIILSHTFIITLCVSGMKKWVSAWFFAYRAEKVAYRPDTHVCTWGEPWHDVCVEEKG